MAHAAARLGHDPDRMGFGVLRVLNEATLPHSGLGRHPHRDMEIVTSSGIESYVFESRLHRKTIRIVLNAVKGSMTIRHCRAAATEMKAMVDRWGDSRDVQPQRVADKQGAKAEAAKWGLLLIRNEKVGGSIHLSGTMPRLLLVRRGAEDFHPATRAGVVL